MFRPVFLILAAAFISACSGSETQDVLLGPSGSSSSPGGSNTSAGSGDEPNDSNTQDTDANGQDTSNVPCEREQEPNDDKQTANVLSSARCGTLSQQDQKDFLTFRLKLATQHMSLHFIGKVRLRIDVDGKDTTEMTPDHSDMVPLVKNADYTIEVTALEGDRDVEWRVDLVER